LKRPHLLGCCWKIEASLQTYNQKIKLELTIANEKLIKHLIVNKLPSNKNIHKD
jgi:hypothetical protein